MKKIIDNETGVEIIANAALEGKTYHDEDCLESIKNKTLKSNIKSYLQNEQKGKKAAWNMVRLIANMSDYIKEDFGSDYKFAEFMECSQSTINKRKRLGNYAVELELNGFSDSQAMELLPLLSLSDKKLVEIYGDDIDTIEAIRILLVKDISSIVSPDLSQKEIRKVVKNLTVYNSEIDNRLKIDINEEPNTDSLDDKNISSESDSQSQSLDDYDDSEPEQLDEYIQYTLPWIMDGGLVDETVQVSNEIALELAKAIMDIINKYDE